MPPPPEQMPAFSIVVPTCDRPDDLALCLERLEPGPQCEVIVTDDSRAPGVPAALRARFPGVLWIAGPRRGPAANRNCGARRARGAWLAFSDDDCLPDPGWIGAYAAARRRHPGARVLEGRVYAGTPKPRCDAVAPLNENGDLLWSCNFAIERALFEGLGGFDERFPHAAMEDVDLRVRLEKGGWSPVFCRDAAVRHPWRPAPDVARRCAAHLESVLLFNRLHPDRAVTVRGHLHAMLRRYGKWAPADLARFGTGAIRHYARWLRADAACLAALHRQGREPRNPG